jgi:hypothetical protein
VHGRDRCSGKSGAVENLCAMRAQCQRNATGTYNHLRIETITEAQSERNAESLDHR